MPFETIAPPYRLCRKVAYQLRHMFDAGEYAVGDPLPPEHVLAGRLGISRPAIREALIEIEGRVRIQAGSRNHVAEPPREIGDILDQRMTLIFTRLSGCFENPESWNSALAGHRGFALRLREAIRSACVAMGNHLRNSQERFLRSFSTPGTRQGVALKEVAGAR